MTLAAPYAYRQGRASGAVAERSFSLNASFLDCRFAMNTYFLVYLIGYGLMIAAVWLGLDAAGVSQTWKLVAAAFLLGLGIIYAFSQAQTDTAQREQARNTGGGSPQQGGAPPQSGPQQGGTSQQGGSPQQGGAQGNNPQQGGGPQ
jgi:uncharacterized membrane protein YgcG